MVPGRTGIIVLLVLFIYFLGRALRARGLALAGVALAALAVVVLASPDSMLHRRITLADEEFEQWRAGVPPDPTSSVGQRLELLRNTLEIIRHNPVFGVGTGGLRQGLCGPRRARPGPSEQNPHNEILMMVAQFGIAGFVLLVGLVRDAVAAGGAPARPPRAGGGARTRADDRRGERAVLDAGGSRRGVLLRLHERTPVRRISRRPGAIRVGSGAVSSRRPRRAGAGVAGARERAGGRHPAHGRRPARRRR